MKTIQKRKGQSILAFFLAIMLCFSGHFTFVTYAEDTNEKQQKLEDNLSELNKNKASVSKELSAATTSLETTLADIAQTQEELGLAKARQTGQYEMMKKRIKFIYESSSGGFLTMLLESESMADLLNKADFITAVSEYDRNMLEELQSVHAEIEKKEQTLLNQQKALSSQKKTLSEKYEQLSSMANDAADDLSAYKEELARAEAAAKASQETLAKKEPSSGGSSQNGSSGNSSQNNTPGNSGSQTPSQPEKPSVPSNVEDVALFAGILECEAGSTNYDALLAVATVIMNRVESPRYPNTLQGVIYQSGQFSPTWTGKLDKVLARGPKPLCYTVARDALAGARLDAVRNCYSFRASWTGHEGVVIGGNVFF